MKKIIKLGLILGLLSQQLQAVGTAFEDEGYRQNVTSARPLEKLEVPSLTPIVLLGTLGSILSLSFVSNITLSLCSFYYMAKRIKVRNEIIKLNQRIDAQNAGLAIG